MAALNERGLFYQVHPFVAGYVADLLVNMAVPLIVECDGSYFHQHRAEYDAERDAGLTKLGYRVLRLSEAEIKARDWSRLGQALTDAAGG